MAALSIALGVLSLACIAFGVLATPIPVLGALFSFAAPALAIAGIVVGGRAMSRARQAGAVQVLGEGQTAGDVVPSAPAAARAVPSHGVALTGVIVSTFALLPALLTAMTCGVCNALCSTGQIQTRRDFQFDIQRGFPSFAPDAGIQPPAKPDGDEPPPPAFPPPPLRSP